MPDQEFFERERMRIVVISDTHRDFNSLYELVQQQKARTQLFLHLGDGEREIEDLLGLEPDLPLRCVRGNCDWSPAVPVRDCFAVGRIKIFMTHGHEHQVKYSLTPLEEEARALRASIALFGHTHCQYYSYTDGLYLLNPGSLSQPRGSARGYGVIEIRDGQVLCNLVQLHE